MTSSGVCKVCWAMTRGGVCVQAGSSPLESAKTAGHQAIVEALEAAYEAAGLEEP